VGNSSTTIRVVVSLPKLLNEDNKESVNKEPIKKAPEVDNAMARLWKKKLKNR
jgi:hypothetical protein